MPFEWPLVRVEEIAEKIGMGPFGSSIKVETFVNVGIPIISGQHLHGMSITEDSFNYITEEHAEKLKNANVYRGDVVFTHAGTIGQVAYIPKNSRFARYVISQRQFYLRCKSDKVLPQFVVYYFRSPEGRHKLLANASQVGVPSLSRPATNLRAIEIPLPSLDEQQRIVEVIDGLEAKIALLRETNTSLEAIAQALFKSWFVDFDPVRAKAEGRDSEGVPPEVADLFPSEFEDWKSAEIPKGWKASQLDQACEINPTRRLSKGTEAPYLEMAAVPTSGHRPKAPIRRAFSSGTKFVNGDTLLARITPCLENGKTAFVDFLEDGAVGWGSTEYIVLRPRSPMPDYWAYLLCRHEPFRQFAIQAMVGTSGRQRVEVSRLAQYPVAVPDEQVAAAFAAIVEPLRARIAANDEEAKTLSRLREALLPRLMSGKLRIPLEGGVQ